MSKGNKRRRKSLGLLEVREKCKARNRFGEPCKRWPMQGSVVCASHGGAAPQVRKKALERIALAQDDAASLLVRFMGDDGVPYSERRRCAEFLLTYEHRNDVSLVLAKWEQNIEDLIVDGLDDVVEAEIVEDIPRAIPPSDTDWADDREDSRLVKAPRGPRHQGR